MSIETGITDPHNDQQIMVSIVCTAYNQEAFIGKTLDGFVMQKTNFPIEIIVHDDASTDNTAAIIRQYETRYPHLFVCIYQTENQYFKQNIWHDITLPAARGKYIAICEGDDYWVDPLKLQKQVDFLEMNPEYGLVHTNYMVVDEFNNALLKYNRTWPSGNVFNLLLNSAYNIVTATVLFRAHLYGKCKQELAGLNFKMGDFPMWLEISHASKFKFLDDLTTNYRVLKNSASHSQDIKKVFLFHENVMLVQEYFSKKYNVPFNKNNALSKLYEKMIKECYFKKNPVLAGQYYLKMIANNIQNFFKPRPLLFLLGSRYKIFDRFIELIYNSTNPEIQAVRQKSTAVSDL